MHRGWVDGCLPMLGRDDDGGGAVEFVLLQSIDDGAQSSVSGLQGGHQLATEAQVWFVSRLLLRHIHGLHSRVSKRF